MNIDLIEIRKRRNETMTKRIKALLEQYGSWNLSCIYMTAGHQYIYNGRTITPTVLAMGTIINIETEGKYIGKVQISIHPIPDPRTYTINLAAQNTFIDPCDIIDIYKPL